MSSVKWRQFCLGLIVYLYLYLIRFLLMCLYLYLKLRKKMYLYLYLIKRIWPQPCSGNAQFGSKSAIFCPLWPWNLMDDLGKRKGTSSILHQALCIISNPSVNWNWSYSPETLNLGQNRQFLVPCDLEIWRLPLKNNRAPLLCCFKLCASFHSHQWIQTGVTVRKRPIWVKFDDF